MKISISYEEAKRFYPKQVKDIMFKLRESSSKHKDAREQDLQWSLDWCVMGSSISGLQFVEYLKKGEFPEHKPEPDSFEAYWADLEPRIIISFYGKIGRWRKRSDKEFSVPDEVKDYYYHAWEKQKKEKERISALTPEEKEKETHGILSKLSDLGGFSAVKIDRKK